MTKFIIFLLSTSGLVAILLKGLIFKSLREYISSKCATTKYRYGIFWFITNMLNCSTCSGFWMSMIMYYFVYGNINLSIIPFCFSGAIVSHLLIAIIELLNRK